MDLRADGALTLRLLGPFALEGATEAVQSIPKKAQAILAYLARRNGTPVPRETLTALLWSDSEDEQARASLRTALSSIRRYLGEQGATLEVSDPMAGHLGQLARRYRGDPRGLAGALCGTSEVFGADLSTDAAFTAEIAERLASLYAVGSAKTMLQCGPSELISR